MMTGTDGDAFVRQSPLVSLVICTRNRASTLRACLRAVAGLHFAPHQMELIVVDNGSTDETREVLQEFAASAPFPVKVVSEPIPGVSRAKNAGVRVAEAALIAFTDDDCYVDPDHLGAVIEAFEKQEYGYIGGRVLLHDPSDARETIKEAGEPEQMPPFSVVPAGFIHGANLAFRRTVWQQIGGFDEMFGSPGPFVAEDLDFAGRASAAGWAGAYLPGPTVRHHHGRKPGPEIDRLRATYNRGIAAYLAKSSLNPSVRRDFLRYWYWRVIARVKRRRLVDLAHEFAGAAEYLVRRAVAFTRRGRPTALR